MSPDEGGEVEDAPAIDIKSRIAAFSQRAAASTSTASTSTQTAPTTSRVSKPILRKTPSTSQLLPAWQQQQQHQQQQRERQLNSNDTAATRPRASTVDENKGATMAAAEEADATAAATATIESASNEDKSRGNSPKLGVKGILALYGQQSQMTTSELSSPEIRSLSRELPSDGTSTVGQLFPSTRPTKMEALRRPVPPPALPPRPKYSNAFVSQTNTGSSSHSASSNSGLATSAAQASPPSSYTPYLRKGSNASLFGNTNGRDSPAPALPRRVGAAHSVEDLTLDPSHSYSLPSSGIRNLGSGPKWASSSSGNLTTESESPTMIAPAVPPRVSASVTNSPLSLVSSPPPPKRTIAQSPKNARNQSRSTTSASHGNQYPSPAALSNAVATTTASPSSISEYIPRSAKKSLVLQHLKDPSSSSSMIAPPPRHVDIRRMATTTTSAAALSIRSTKRQQKLRFKALQAGAIYTKDPGDAEQRYTLLFYRLLKDQQVKDGGDSALLNKRTVVKVWKQSQLEDWYLAKVWEAATTVTQNSGISKAAFTRAMSAIDNELSRRQTERQNRTV